MGPFDGEQGLASLPLVVHENDKTLIVTYPFDGARRYPHDGHPLAETQRSVQTESAT